MPLITVRDRRKKTVLHTEILSSINEDIHEYCKWSGITDIGFFVEEAAKYIFFHDNLWQKFFSEEKQIEKSE